jgi:hypothetical protein
MKQPDSCKAADVGLGKTETLSGRRGNECAANKNFRLSKGARRRTKMDESDVCLLYGLSSFVNKGLFYCLAHFQKNGLFFNTLWK